MQRFDYIKNLIPICFEPGHMGTFFMRLLLDPHIKDASEIVLKHHSFTPAYEWKIDDRVGNYFGFGHTRNLRLAAFEDIHNILKPFNFTGLDEELAILHVLLKVTEKSFTKEGLAEKIDFIDWSKKISDEEIINAINDTAFTDSQCAFPYIKSHLMTYHQVLKDFSFNKIIFLKFPPNKSWIAEIILFYKHYWFWIGKSEYWKKFIFTRPEAGRFSGLSRLKNIINKNCQNHFDEIDSWINLYFKKDNVIHIDMYDLIFNGNTDQLTKINFDFNHDRIQSLLQSTKQQTIEICNKFSLDTNLDIDIKTDPSPLDIPELRQSWQDVYDYYISLDKQKSP